MADQNEMFLSLVYICLQGKKQTNKQIKQKQTNKQTSLNRLRLLMTASIVKGITFAVVNRSVHANATISMVVDERSLGLTSGMKHRIALPTKATILKIIKTVDSTATVVLFLDSSCKMANTSRLVSPGSMLFMAQTQEAKIFLRVDKQQLIFCNKKKIGERMHLIYR